MELPLRKSGSDASDEIGEPTTEAQRLLKFNNSVLRDASGEISYIKSLVGTLTSNKTKIAPQNTPDKKSPLAQKVLQAEEKLIENLSSSLQTISQLTSTLNDTSSPNQTSQIANLVQSLYTNLTKTIQDYPDFSTQLGASRDNLKGSLNSSQKSLRSFKDKLVKDQSDIKTKLRSTLNNIESQQANEIYTKLVQEIERNQELQGQLESKNASIYRLNLIFSEGVERSTRSLEQLVKLADSEEAQTLLEFVLNEIALIKGKHREVVEINKGSGWKLDEAILKVEKEYETQKELWERTLRDLREVNDGKMDKLIREIEGEREAHDLTQRKLLEAQRGGVQSDKVLKIKEEFKIEINGLNEKLRQKEIAAEAKDREYEELRRELGILEKERGNVLNQLELVKSEMAQVGYDKGRLKDDLLKTGSEKEEIRRNLDEISTEAGSLRRTLNQKSSEIDQLRRELALEEKSKDDLRRGLAQEERSKEDLKRQLIQEERGKEELRRELAQEERSKEDLKRQLIQEERGKEELRREVMTIRSVNEDLERRLDTIANDNRELEQEVKESFDIRQREVEPYKRKTDVLQRENEELREHRELTEALLRKTNEQVDHLKLTYFTDINKLTEENKITTTQKRQISADLDRRTQEVAKLNQMLDSLQDFSNKQLETIKEREEKVTLLITQKRYR